MTCLLAWERVGHRASTGVGRHILPRGDHSCQAKTDQAEICRLKEGILARSEKAKIEQNTVKGLLTSIRAIASHLEVREQGPIGNSGRRSYVDTCQKVGGMVSFILEHMF